MAGSPLWRFRAAQDAGDSYEHALAELRAGRKQSHWMWFVFPQLEGLGRSDTARRYAIHSLEEAREYLADAVLGARLRESAAALLEHEDASAEEMLGSIDALKLRSSMTLFELAAGREPLFARVLERFYGGVRDDATLRLLGLA